MAGVPYRLWADYLERVWAYHGLVPQTVLDLACGTGTVSRLLARRGYAPVGVDLSGGMLAAARERAAAERVSIPFHQQDAAELDLSPQRFDAVVSLFDSLNNILEPPRLAQAFARVYDHLHPGGSFLFDLNTEYALAQGMFTQDNIGGADPLQYDWKSRYDPQTRLCTIEMDFSYDPGDGPRLSFTETHRQRAYLKDEILEMLRVAGFGSLFVYDGYSLAPPKKRSDRLFYLAIKRGA